MLIDILLNPLIAPLCQFVSSHGAKDEVSFKYVYNKHV